jgi:hypothetical protein
MRSDTRITLCISSPRRDVGSVRRPIGSPGPISLGPGLTAHSTGAESARISSSTWMLLVVVSRPVNSSVGLLRGLVNGFVYSETLEAVS